MTSDPYPDLAGADLPDTAMGTGSGGRAAAKPDLDEADSRLLDALSQPEPAVVTAVEDQVWTAPAGPADGPAPAPTSRGRGPLTPVFQEPPG